MFKVVGSIPGVYIQILRIAKELPEITVRKSQNDVNHGDLPKNMCICICTTSKALFGSIYSSNLSLKFTIHE